MTKIAVIPAPGLGDSLIMQNAAHALLLAGFTVTTFTSHLPGFGKWFSHDNFSPKQTLNPHDFDAIILQHDNSPFSKTIKTSHKKVFCFYGSHLIAKHGEITPLDYVCHPNMSMNDNLSIAMTKWFGLPSYENGLTAPPNLTHKKHPRRVIVHANSSSLNKNWPMDRFNRIVTHLKQEGFDPVFLPLFPRLEDLAAFIYESGAFIGNDSGPGHLASCLDIPSLIIGTSHQHMLLWRPGWLPPAIVTPPHLSSHFKWTRKHWKWFVSTGKVLKQLKISILNNIDTD